MNYSEQIEGNAREGKLEGNAGVETPSRVLELAQALAQSFVGTSLGAALASRLVPSSGDPIPPQRIAAARSAFATDIPRSDVWGSDTRRSDTPRLLPRPMGMQFGQNPKQTGAIYPVPEFLKEHDDNRNGSAVYTAYNLIYNDPAQALRCLRALSQGLISGGFSVSSGNPPFLEVLLNNGKELPVLARTLARLWPSHPQNYIQWPYEFENLDRPLVVPICLLIRGSERYEVRSLVPVYPEDLTGEIILREAVDAHRWDSEIAYGMHDSSDGSVLHNGLVLAVGLPCIRGYDLWLRQPLAHHEFASHQMAVFISHYVYYLIRSMDRNMRQIPLEYTTGQPVSGHHSVADFLDFSLSTRKSGTVVFPRTEIWTLDIYHKEQRESGLPMIQFNCARLYERYLRDLCWNSRWENSVLDELVRGLAQFMSPERFW